MSPQTKHIDVKYHWFRSKISLKEIIVMRINTESRRAELFKKGLTKLECEYKRKLIMGW